MSQELNESDDGYYGELSVMRPQVFRWVAWDDTEAFVVVDHVIGFQVVPPKQTEHTGTPRELFVTLANADTLSTSDPDQIDRFLELWEIV